MQNFKIFKIYVRILNFEFFWGVLKINEIQNLLHQTKALPLKNISTAAQLLIQSIPLSKMQKITKIQKIKIFQKSYVSPELSRLKASEADTWLELIYFIPVTPEKYGFSIENFMPAVNRQPGFRRGGDSYSVSKISFKKKSF